MDMRKQRPSGDQTRLKLRTVADLSRHIGVSIADLGALAQELDAQGEHSVLYRSREQPKKTSGVRCIDAPQRKLKWVQQRINDRLLQHVPVHPTVRGGVRGTNVRSHVRPHVGKPMVANFDIENFFSSIRFGQVYALFHRMGCAPDAARLLTRLTTFKGRLPQGAPTSSMLANLIVGYGEHSFALRQANLALQHGSESSMWVDDLTISGVPYLPRLSSTVARIAEQCGLTLNAEKTRFQGHTKRQMVTGIVVNKQPNVPREEYRHIRALLHQCRCRGPRTVVEQSDEIRSVSQLKNSLRGKIAHVNNINSERGAKLLAQYNTINWSE